jgi:hypothetical protein
MSLVSVHAAAGTANDRHILEIAYQPFVESGERAGTGHDRQCQNVVIIGYAVAASMKTRLFLLKSIRVGGSEPASLF